MLSLSALDVFQGKTAIVKLSFVDENTSVRFGKKQLFVVENPNNKKERLLFIPIDYKSPVGEQKVVYFSDNKPQEIFLHVRTGEYKKETLQVDPSRVKPPKKYQDQIYKEYKQAKEIYQKTTVKRYWSKPFIYPLESKITSEFGNARVFNGTLKSYHGGVDFRAPLKTPIKAVNDGVVVLARERYYAGGSIVIDHGYGLYSCYFHLSSYAIKEGDSVLRGDIIGLSGQSGRVTGPHLHFGLQLYDTAIDPLEFIGTLNTLLAN